MGNWFASVDSTRRELPGGEWLQIKTELTYHDEQHLYSGVVNKMETAEFGKDRPAVGIDMGEFNIRRMLTWIVGWSAKDAKGNAVEFSESAVRALSSSMAKAINDALDTYLEELEATKS